MEIKVRRLERLGFRGTRCDTGFRKWVFPTPRNEIPIATTGQSGACGSSDQPDTGDRPLQFRLSLNLNYLAGLIEFFRRTGAAAQVKNPVVLGVVVFGRANKTIHLRHNRRNWDRLATPATDDGRVTRERSFLHHSILQKCG